MISDRYVVGLNAFPRDAAITVVQRFDDTAPPLFEIVFLERLDLDDSIVNYVHRFLQSPPLRDSGDVELVVGFGAGDTGVFDVCGFPVFTTMIVVVGQGSHYQLRSTASEISKSRLLGNAQNLRQGGRLKMASGIAELPNGGHDDIVLAVALALWRAV